MDADAFNRFELAGWEGAGKADRYHDFFGPITSRAIEPLMDAAGVRAGQRVLDVATGPGYAAAAAARRGATVTGVDISGQMVALASLLHPEVQFREGDAENLPFAGAAFDAVIANFAILHLGRPEQAAAELARILVPGGRAALTAWDVPEKTRYLGVFVDAVQAAEAVPPADLPPGPPFFASPMIPSSSVCFARPAWRRSGWSASALTSSAPRTSSGRGCSAVACAPPH